MMGLVGIYTVWLREIKRFLRDPSRIVGSFAQPILWLFLMGTGMGSGLGKVFSMGGGSGKFPGTDIDFLMFMYPGIIGMSVLFTSIFSAVSIVWDREFGFLKEMLVAPIPRYSITIGKALGGSTVAMLQGAILLILAPFVGVKFTFLIVIEVALLLFLVSFSLTSLGITIAARMKSMEGFQVIMNFLLMPMFFLSGAMFPLSGLPSWMDKLVKLDPLTYGVDAIRGAILGHQEAINPMTGKVFLKIPIYSLTHDVSIVALFGAVMIILAVWQFNRAE